MTEEYYFYETIPNDRWDLIAKKFYGNCYDIFPIINANFHIMITPCLEKGLELRIPVKNNSVQVNNGPNWKKQ